MKWFVCLSGVTFDLKELSKSLNNDFLRIEKYKIHILENKDINAFRLESELFDSITDYDLLNKKANEIIKRLNGASKLTLNSRKPIVISSIERINDDGKKEIFMSITETVNVRDSFSISITDINGKTTETHMADPISDWICIASSDNNVAKILCLVGSKQLDWVGLYRIFEVIENDVGKIDNIVDNGWATKASIKRFKHTANSPAAIGDDARHGKEFTSPPAKPMSLSEGKSLVENIIHNWLNSKKAIKTS